jgi:hypothetical protein
MAKKYKKAKTGLKVEPKYLEYENLPCVGCKDHLMAAAGLYMGPGPKIPGLGKTLQQTLPHMPPLLSNAGPNVSVLPVPGDPGQSGDTSKVQPGQFINPYKYNQPQPQQHKGPNFGNAALLGLAAFDAVLPNPYQHHQVVQPQMAYNPNPYGTGSQAIMQDGGGISPFGNYALQPPQGPTTMRIGDRDVDVDTARQIIMQAKKNKVNPYEALAIAYQESGIEGNNRAYHLNPNEYGSPFGGPELGIKSIIAQDQYARGLQKKGVVPQGDEYRLQGYNGYGTIKKGHADLEGAKSIYGIPIPNEGINMKKNPLYGKRIIDIMNNTLKTNPQLKGMIDKGEYGYVLGEDENNSPSAKNGKQMKSKKKNSGAALFGFSEDALPEAKDGHWIQGAVNPAHKGYCTPMTKSTCTPRRKALAKTFKKHHGFHKKEAGAMLDPMGNDYMDMISAQMAYGGIIPDPMSNFSPHQYEQGGNVNGGANLREVGPNYPNTDLLEQWLLYANGGNVNGGADLREVGPNYPNTDLMEQWLLYENGGSLSAGKAKEMLRDGTANGKKLTAKQKKYFGMVASGKAAMGTEIGFNGPGSGDPTRPNNSPVLPVTQFRNQAGINGTNAFADNVFAMDHQTNRMSRGMDMIHNIIGSGTLPNQTGQDKMLRSTLDPQMYNYLYQFNQRNDLKGMSPEQRIQTFYDIPSSDTNIQAMKTNMKRYGYGPQEFRRTQSLEQFTPAQTQAKMRSGGIMYDDGGEVQTMWGGNANLESYNPYDGGMIGFNGPSHDNGGIGMAYNGNPVEVEGGEYASRDGDGNLNIYGNMYMPGTKTKFKAVAGAIVDKEKRYNFLKNKGSKLVNDSNPANKYDQLAFNAGRVMMQGGQMGMADLATKKEQLASLQKSMLDMAAQHGLDPFEMSKGKMKKAKGGASIPFSANGSTQTGDPDQNDPTRADRNMNPGNIKYGTFAKKYGAKPDKDGFAIFPNREVGQKAMQELLTSDSYKNMSAKDAIRKWTGGNPYRFDLGPISDKKISEMNPDELSIVMGTMTKGEGTRYGVTGRKTNKTVPTTPLGTPSFTPYKLPDIPAANPYTPVNPRNPAPPYNQLEISDIKPIPSNVEPLHLNQLAGEIYAAATNKVEPVPAQRYEPQLYTPYQVSFQDRLNANQSAFNAEMRAVGAGNPAALGALGAQKYQADQGVYGDEFRTNQAIANDITNKNIALVNDANLKNLGIADTQMTRQSQARSRTRELNQMILNSISDKYAKNDYENKTLAAYENLYDYRFVPQEDGGLSATYFGPNAMFNYDGKTNNTSMADPSRRISRYDAQGNLVGYADYDDSQLKDRQKALQVQKLQRTLPLMQVPPLNRK